MSWFSKLFQRAPRVELRETWTALRPRVAHLAQTAIHLAHSTDPTSCWLGGSPMVSSETFAWPESLGEPMAFLGQLDLAQLHTAHRVEWLPSSGSLAFFYDVKEMSLGDDPKNRGKWKVLYLEETNAAPASTPVFNRVFVRPMKVEVFPDADSAAMETVELSGSEPDAYDWFRRGVDNETPAHQVAGFPSPILMTTMELECQLAANGIPLENTKAYETPEAKALAPGASDWRLLLQCDSDPDVGMRWGDIGMVYFWIREQDARERRFDETWLILQGT